MIAGKLNIPEVCVYFDDKLFRGNRCTKIDIWGFNAFHSFNYPPLATIGVDITFVGHTLHKPTSTFIK
jgi:L-asparaginase